MDLKYIGNREIYVNEQKICFNKMVKVNIIYPWSSIKYNNFQNATVTNNEYSEPIRILIFNTGLRYYTGKIAEPK